MEEDEPYLVDHSVTLRLKQNKSIGNNASPPSSEIEQRVLFAKEAAQRSNSAAEGDRQYDYISERMLPASINQAMPILTVDQFSDKKNTLLALSNNSARTSEVKNSAITNRLSGNKLQ